MCDQVTMAGSVGSMNAQRLLTAANTELSDKVEDLSRELWMRTWCRVSSCNSSNCAYNALLCSP